MCAKFHKNPFSVSRRVSCIQTKEFIHLNSLRKSAFSFYSKRKNPTKFRTIILPVVLYGCETRSLTLREEHRLRVFENRVLRRIFWLKRDGITEEWRKLHNEELNDLYSSPNIVRMIKWRRMRWAGRVARMEEERGVHKVLVGKPEGKGPLGRPRRR